MAHSLNLKKYRSDTPLSRALKPLIFELNDSAPALVPRTAAISVPCLKAENSHHIRHGTLQMGRYLSNFPIVSMHLRFCSRLGCT